MFSVYCVFFKIKLQIIEWLFFFTSPGLTYVIVVLFNRHLVMPHLLCGSWLTNLCILIHW